MDTVPKALQTKGDIMEERVDRIVHALQERYPDAHCELDFSTPLEILIATCLSAQTTDKQVNKVTKVLFADCRTLDDYLALTPDQIRAYIHTLGFYNNKADNLYKMVRQLADRFHGEVPATREELTTLAGVGRKTANVVLSNAFGEPAIAVDTHVFRVANRIGLTHAKTVEETEQQLMEALDREDWSLMHHVLIFHGRYCCHARKPECDTCPIRKDCEYASAVIA